MESKKAYVVLEVVVIMGFVTVLAISILTLSFQHKRTITEYAKTFKASTEIQSEEKFFSDFKEYLKEQKIEEEYKFIDLEVFSENIEDKIYSIYYKEEENIFEVEIKNMENNSEKYTYSYEIEKNEIVFLKLTK